MAGFFHLYLDVKARSLRGVNRSISDAISIRYGVSINLNSLFVMYFFYYLDITVTIMFLKVNVLDYLIKIYISAHGSCNYAIVSIVNKTKDKLGLSDMNNGFVNILHVLYIIYTTNNIVLFDK